MATLHERTSGEILRDAVKRILAPPHIIDDDHSNRIARALHYVILGLIITLLISTVNVLLFGQQKVGSLLFNLVGFSICAIVNRELRHGRVLRAARIFQGAYWLGAAGFAYVSGGLTGASTSILLSSILTAALFIGWRASFITVLLTLVYSLLLAVAEENLPQWFFLTGIRSWFVFFFSILLLLVPLVTLQNGLLRALNYARQQLSEREKAEAALRSSEERHRAVSELISDYAFAFDVMPDGTLVPVWITDDSFERLTGYTWASLGGGFHLYHPDDMERSIADVEKVKQGVELSAEYRIVTKAGVTRWVMMRRKPVWDAAHTRVIRYYAAAQDITDQKQAEKVQFELAVERERRNTYRTLMSGVSHDIKTPLTIINTHLYSLEKNPDPDARQKNMIVIKQQTHRLQDFIEDLLAMSRLDAALDMRLSSVDLIDLVEGVAKELSPLFEQKHISFSRSVENGLPHIQADESLLRRAIVNLMVNAANYTPEAGSIAARLRLQADSAVFEVTDTGIGIPSDELPYIFDPFFRGRGARTVSRNGSGLGLAIVHYVVGHHGGRVEAESVFGTGSTFRIILPASVSAS